jgi:glycosyltransferase involved in cell wall biosynthesis
MFRELLGADAVHAPIPGDIGTVGMLGAFLLRKPLFVRHCGNWLKPCTAAEKFWRWFMERFAGGRNIMLATGGIPEPPSQRNSNVHWIFSSSLSRDELTAHAFPRFFPSNGELRLAHVARQETAKGAGAIIRSLPLLARRFPAVSFDLLGDGSAIPEFRQSAQDLGLNDRVHFAGKLNHEQVMDRLERAHLFVYPTAASDGFPKAVLEGLACGLPVVATHVSVLPQLLGKGCGVLIDEATPEAVARGVEAALASPAGYETMSRKAVEAARQYSLEAWRDTIGGYLTAAWGPLKEKPESRKQKSVVSSPVVP